MAVTDQRNTDLAKPAAAVPPHFRDMDAAPRAAGRQAGTFTRQQALDEGWTVDQVRHRIATRCWIPVCPGALASARTPMTAAALGWAAHLAWPGAVISHLTAAGIHGFPGQAEPVTAIAGSTTPGSAMAQVIVGPAARSVHGIRAHHGELPARDVTRLPGGLLVTTAGRTALDCLATMPLEDAWRLLAWVSTRGVLTRGDLAVAVRQRLGCRGTPQLLTLLRGSAGGAVSGGERRAHGLLRRAGICGWVANARVVDAEGPIGVVDILFPEQRVVIEIDGWAAHGNREAFRNDRRRQNRLVAAGYLILRFTWDDLANRSERVIAEVRSVLAARAA
jgi:hypothetical protein